MRRFTGLMLSVLMLVTLVGLAACTPQEKTSTGGDPMVGTWAMKDNPSKTVLVSKEGDKYFYTGSQPKSECQKTDDKTLVCQMGSQEAPMTVTLTFDHEKGEMTVNFMGEMYNYVKAPPAK